MQQRMTLHLQLCVSGPTSPIVAKPWLFPDTIVISAVTFHFVVRVGGCIANT